MQYTLFAIPIALWLAGLVACALAVRFARKPGFPRFVPALLLAGTALLLGYLGTAQFRFEYSQTVNGVRTQHLDSRWLSYSSLALGAAVLVYVLWRRFAARKTP
jgi:hypothetical protein